MMGPFMFGLGAFTILFFSVETLGGVARMVVESKLGWHMIIVYLMNRLPQVIIFTTPMAVLLSGLMAFGRLSGDSELTALKAAGISFFRIATPGLLLCALVSLTNVYVNEKIVPRSMKKAYDIMFETQKRDPHVKALLTEPRQLKNGESQMLVCNSVDIQKQEMDGVILSYFSADKRRLREVYAQKARWDSTRRVWVLEQMMTQLFDKDGNMTQEVKSAETATAMDPSDSPDDPDTLVRREYRPEELSRAELHDRLEMLPAGQPGTKQAKKRLSYEVMFHQKLALPWTSLIFGAFAIPLGVRPQRSSRSIGLGLSLLFILVYYVLMTIGVIFGESGQLDPMLAAWLPNLIFGSVGLVLLLDATRK